MPLVMRLSKILKNTNSLLFYTEYFVRWGYFRKVNAWYAGNIWTRHDIGGWVQRKGTQRSNKNTFIVVIRRTLRIDGRIGIVGSQRSID
jgi:hypothetical protein